MLNDKIRIVVIDDDEDDYFIIADYIKAIEGGRFKTDWCNDYKEAMDHIRSKTYDLYFVDYRLGNQTGLDLLKEASALENDAPMVLLTGKGCETWICWERGRKQAWDEVMIATLAIKERMKQAE